METQSNIRWFTLLLSAVAGYCDTATFIAGNGTFSAHVTGNFIIFAAQAVLNADPNAWIKLITFPMFIIAVIMGGWLAAKTTKRYLLLLIEGILLLLAGGTAFWLGAGQSGRYVVVMITVLAMVREDCKSIQKIIGSVWLINVNPKGNGLIYVQLGPLH